jgi:two-component system chemotaxis sensor kinase CheA
VTEDEEIVQAFLEESAENLDQLDRDLVDLEERPSDPELLAQVFRTIHTIKGTCGFLDFHHLERLTHAGEDLLGALRAGDLVLDRTITTSLLGLVDAVRLVLGRIEATGDEGDDDHAPVRADLARHLPGRSGPGAPPEPEPLGTPEPRPVAGSPAAESPSGPGELGRQIDGGHGGSRPEAGPDPGAEEVRVAPVDDAVEPVAVPGRVVAPTGGRDPEAEAVVVETSVRVDIGVLDKLLDLVGELVLAQGRIGAVAGSEEDGPLALPYRDLRLLTGELQEGVMKARLQPVGTVIGRLRRIARDLATSLDKQVHVELEGEGIGVDKAVNEALRDPLLHLVRNAVDHGIEPPAVRVAAGKPPEGRLRIRAHHEGGRVQVEISDDGRGIDAAGLVRRSVETGVLTADASALLSPAEQVELMFHPGLSTKDEVTSVSGRGVGMDVVRSNLEKVGGTVDAWSEPGKGSVFRINVPLTLAILPALLIWCGGRRYALPQVDVHEIVHLGAAEVEHDVDDVGGARVHRLRGRLLPLVGLADRLDVEPEAGDGGLTIVVVARDERRFGLVVDAVGDTTEAVAKPFPQVIRSIAVFSGVVILGDGMPALILDVAGLAVAAGVEHGRDESGDLTARRDALFPTAGAGSLVLARGGDGTRLAFQLDAVRRLEQFPSADIQRLGAREVVDYRGMILPLVRVSDQLGNGSRHDRVDDQGVVHAVVCESSVGPVGLIVEGIEDVVPEPLAPPQPASRRGVSACLLLGDRITELVDVEVLVGDAALERTA